MAYTAGLVAHEALTAFKPYGQKISDGVSYKLSIFFNSVFAHVFFYRRRLLPRNSMGESFWARILERRAGKQICFAFTYLRYFFSLLAEATSLFEVCTKYLREGAG